MKTLDIYLKFLNEQFVPVTILPPEQKKKYLKERKECNKLPTFIKRMKCRNKVDQKYGHGGFVT